MIDHPYVIGEPGTVLGDSDTLHLHLGQTVTLTILMHPAGKAFLSSGILPRTAIALARDWVAPGLARIAPALRTGPVLVETDLAAEGQVRLPKVSVFGTDQDFWYRETPGSWRNDAILAATQTALLPDTPAELRDGWIRVRPTTEDGTTTRRREHDVSRYRWPRQRTPGATRRPGRTDAVPRAAPHRGRPARGARHRSASCRRGRRRHRWARAGRRRTAVRGAVGAAEMWVPLGPSTVIDGQAEGDPRVAGRVRALWVHPNGQRIYAATANGGVWYSADGADSWRSIGGFAETDTPDIVRPAHRHACGAITVVLGADVNDQTLDTVYVGTGELTPGREADAGSALGGIGILVATGPASAVTVDPWVEESPNLLHEGVYRFAVDPTGRHDRGGDHDRPAPATGRCRTGRRLGARRRRSVRRLQGRRHRRAVDPGRRRRRAGAAVGVGAGRRRRRAVGARRRRHRLRPRSARREP